MPPIIIISGANTELHFPEGIAVDPSGNIQLANRSFGTTGSVTVYPAGSDGNVKPIATVTGDNIRLGTPLWHRAGFKREHLRSGLALRGRQGCCLFDVAATATWRHRNHRCGQT